MHSNVKVLLVDDNPMVLGLLTNALAQSAVVSTANDAADALMRVIDEAFDLIVSDYQMPGMDGRQLLEKIRSRSATSRIPFVLIASKTDLTEKLKMVQDSVEDFVEKPFFVKEAAGRIKRIIDVRLMSSTPWPTSTPIHATRAATQAVAAPPVQRRRASTAT